MADIAFIEHQGTRILYEDYSHATIEELPDLLDKAHGIIASQPEKSVLAIANMEGTHFDSNTVQRMKLFIKSNTPYIRATAVIGMSALQSVIFKTILRFTGRKNLRVCGSMEEARNYLSNLGT